MRIAELPLLTEGHHSCNPQIPYPIDSLTAFYNDRVAWNVAMVLIHLTVTYDQL
jgi:hypothetical protein